MWIFLLSPVNRPLNFPLFLFIDFVGRRINNYLLESGRSAAKAMEDIQNHKDYRKIDIDQVGVKGIRYPITVLDKDEGEQQTVAKINMYVSLPHPVSYTHLTLPTTPYV